MHAAIPGRIRWWLTALLCGKVAVFLAALPLPFGGVHNWRQSDTLGVALRYWLKFSQEPWQPELLLPAVLNRGDGNGIMAMEFPLIGLSLAPAFSLGPLWGTAAARLGLLLLTGFAFWQAAKAWRHQRIAGVSGPLIVALLPVLSLSSVYTFKFMPDALSLALFMWGLGLVWASPRPGRGAAGVLLLSLGLLLKPTTIVAAGIILLGDGGGGSWASHRLRAVSIWLKAVLQRAAFVLLPLAVAVIYYTAGLSFIESFADSPGLFKVGLQSLAGNLATAVAGAEELPDLLVSKLLFAPGLLLLAAVAVVLRWQGKSAEQGPERGPEQGQNHGPSSQLGAWLVLGLQLLAIFAIDGDHAYVHEYYFIGCAPVLLWLLVVNVQGTCRRWPHVQRPVLAVVFILAAVSALDKAYFSLRGYAEPFRSRIALGSDCAALKAKTPKLPWNQGYSFRSHPHPFPVLGLCFHEREGHSRARYGLYHVSKPAPAGCRIVAGQGGVQVADCQ